MSGEFFDNASLRGRATGLSQSSLGLSKSSLGLSASSLPSIPEIPSVDTSKLKPIPIPEEVPGVSDFMGPPAPNGTLVTNNPDTFALDKGWNYNVLSDLAMSTYNIKFFMADDQPFSVGAFSSGYSELHDHITKSKNVTVIAQSGVTGLNIKSLAMESVMAPSRVSRSTNAVKFQMVIYEPGGVAMMDLLADTARELGIRDYAKAHYFLELSFKGYDDSGNMVINPCSTFNNKGSWLYAVIIGDMEVDVSESGATYTLTMHPIDAHLATSGNIALPSQIAPEGQTLGTMLEDFATKLTKSMESMYGYEYHRFSVNMPSFDFQGSTKDPASFKVSPADQDLTDRRNTPMNARGDGVRGQFPAGHKVNDAVETILSNCEEVQMLAKGVEVQHELDHYGNKFRECLVFRVNFTTEIRKYDDITNAYLMDYTIHVTPYFTEVPILSKSQIEITKDQSVQRDNALKLRKGGFLSKKYDYLYSGMNTEILNFDLKYNAAWAAMLPKAMGMGYSIEANSNYDLMKKGDKLKHLKDEILRDQETLREHQRINEQIKVLNDQPESPERDQQLNQLREDKMKLAQEDEIRNTIGSNKREYERTISQDGTPRITDDRPQIRYAEEVYEASSTNALSAVLPLATAQAPSDTRFYPNGSFPDQHHRDRTILGAVFDQLYDTGAALQQIEMSIKGDPFWLGPGGVQQIWNMHHNRHLNVENPAFTEYQDYNKGDALLLVYFRYPRGIDEFGAPKFKAQDFFTGVYMVQKVKHSFDGGEFKQTIEAIRMPLIDVYKAFGADPDKTGSSDQAIEAGGLPASAMSAAEATLNTATQAVTEKKETILKVF